MVRTGVIVQMFSVERTTRGTVVGVYCCTVYCVFVYGSRALYTVTVRYIVVVVVVKLSAVERIVFVVVSCFH